MSFRAQQGGASVSEALERAGVAQPRADGDDELKTTTGTEAEMMPALKKGFLGGRVPMKTGGATEPVNAADGGAEEDEARIVEIGDEDGATGGAKGGDATAHASPADDADASDDDDSDDDVVVEDVTRDFDAEEAAEKAAERTATPQLKKGFLEEAAAKRKLKEHAAAAKAAEAAAEAAEEAATAAAEEEAEERARADAEAAAKAISEGTALPPPSSAAGRLSGGTPLGAGFLEWMRDPNAIAMAREKAAANPVLEALDGAAGGGGGEGEEEELMPWDPEPPPKPKRAAGGKKATGGKKARGKNAPEVRKAGVTPGDQAGARAEEEGGAAALARAHREWAAGDDESEEEEEEEEEEDGDEGTEGAGGVRRRARKVFKFNAAPKLVLPTGRDLLGTGGLLKRVLRPGSSLVGKPPANAMCKVHYTGWLMDGTRFDSSRDRFGNPFFKLGSGIVRSHTLRPPTLLHSYTPALLHLLHSYAPRIFTPSRLHSYLLPTW